MPPRLPGRTHGPRQNGGKGRWRAIRRDQRANDQRLAQTPRPGRHLNRRRGDPMHNVERERKSGERRRESGSGFWIFPRPSPFSNRFAILHWRNSKRSKGTAPTSLNEHGPASQRTSVAPVGAWLGGEESTTTSWRRARASAYLKPTSASLPREG